MSERRSPLAHPPLAHLHFVVPGRLEQRTGGYLYDARMVAELRARGWAVDVVSLAGRFPRPDRTAQENMDAALAGIPDDSLVVVDGLAMEALHPNVEGHAARLNLVLLVHHLISDELGRSDEPTSLRDLETSVLGAVSSVVTTSRYTAERIEALGLPQGGIRVVEPGTTPAKEGGNRGSGREVPMLLCVASLTPRKGHDTLVDALSAIRDLPWECIFVGSTDRDPAHADRVRALVQFHGLDDRIAFLGECDEDRVRSLYHEADLLVLASRFEGYGMVLTEAMAHGLPVVATTGGAIPYTVPDDAGRLVPPDDPGAFARALRGTLGEEGAPVRLRLAAGARRYAAALPDWSTAGERFEEALRAFVRGRAFAGGEGSSDGRFTREWLALREPADRRSRDEALASALDEYLSSTAPTGSSSPGIRECTIVDLGAGTGAGPRWLASRLSCDQRWILIDQSAEALLEATRHPPEVPSGVRSLVEVREGDLADSGLSAIEEADAVTASALLDLVSDAWLRRLVASVSARGCPALFALTYDGTITWSDPDPLDELVVQAVNEHQRRDKGLGPALGPTAPDRARDLFRTEGLTVLEANTPWTLGPEDAELVAALIEGWREASGDVRRDRVDEIDAWAARRGADVRERGVRLTVGHRDLLALPGR